MVITNSHCAYIKDFSRFMYNETKYRSKMHFCRYYLQCFRKQRILIIHKKVCLKFNYYLQCLSKQKILIIDKRVCLNVNGKQAKYKTKK